MPWDLQHTLLATWAAPCPMAEGFSHPAYIHSQLYSHHRHRHPRRRCHAAATNGIASATTDLYPKLQPFSHADPVRSGCRANRLNAAGFVLMGLPGGLDYLMLVFVKLKVTTPTLSCYPPRPNLLLLSPIPPRAPLPPMSLSCSAPPMPITSQGRTAPTPLHTTPHTTHHTTPHHTAPLTHTLL